MNQALAQTPQQAIFVKQIYEVDIFSNCPRADRGKSLFLSAANGIE